MLMIRRTPEAWVVGVAAALALAVAATVAFPGAAYEGRSGSVTRMASQQLYDRPPLVIPAAAFSYIGVAPPPSSAYHFEASGGYVRGGYVCVTAPVYLPQRARVGKMYASLYDGEPGVSARVYLYRTSNLVQTTTEMAALETPVDQAAVQIVADLSINARTIEYPEYSYYAFACLDTGNTRLYAVRIYFDTYVYLPAVIKNTGF